MKGLVLTARHLASPGACAQGARTGNATKVGALELETDAATCLPNQRSHTRGAAQCPTYKLTAHSDIIEYRTPKHA